MLIQRNALLQLYIIESVQNKSVGDWNERKNICRLNLVMCVLIITMCNKDDVISVRIKIELCAVNEFKDLIISKKKKKSKK